MPDVVEAYQLKSIGGGLDKPCNASSKRASNCLASEKCMIKSFPI